MRLLRRQIRLVLAACASVVLALAVPTGAAWALAGADSGAAVTGEAAAGGGNVGGQGQQLSKLTQEQTPEEKEEEAAEKNAAALKATESKPISTGLIVLIGGVALVLIGGIAFLIMRDARSVAPASGLSESASPGQAARQRRRRAQAKAARQSRKRNR